MVRIACSLEFELFYEREFPRVYRGVLACCLDGDVALDATQEAFSRALARWRRLRAHRWSGGWVMTTALNEMRRLVRQCLLPQPVESGASTAFAEGIPQRLELLDAMKILTYKQRTIALLFYWADLPTPAISELTGISESGVRAHLANARKRLRTELEVLVDGT
jgi:RNA polymerase sigma-70 factor (ECF subfamily)